MRMSSIRLSRSMFAYPSSMAAARSRSSHWASAPSKSSLVPYPGMAHHLHIADHRAGVLARVLTVAQVTTQFETQEAPSLVGLVELALAQEHVQEERYPLRPCRPQEGFRLVGRVHTCTSYKPPLALQDVVFRHCRREDFVLKSCHLQWIRSLKRQLHRRSRLSSRCDICAGQVHTYASQADHVRG